MNIVAPQQESEAEVQLKAATRMLRVKKARDHLLDFTHLTMPRPEDPDDSDASRYSEAIHHVAIAELLEKMERGEILRAIITMPPRHGKSELCSRRFPPWFIGKNAYRQVIFCTYSQEFADDFGREWRDIIKTPVYRQVFPGVELKKDSQAADRMNITMNGTPYGGVMVAVGIGGAVTGRGADLALIDDPIKNKEEADSALIRDQRWNWFTSTLMTRLMPGGAVLIVLTRWHEDDIVGRIFNPEYVDPEEAKTWTVLSLPAEKDGKALWPERYPIKVLESIRKTVGPRVWSALYQQRPAPEDGLYFTKSMIRTYQPQDLPVNLRIYAASDHAVTVKQENDPNVLGCIGVDSDDVIWVLPDLIWERMETERTVEEMLSLMRRRKPMIWWAEDDVINKAIGPFLRKRMREEKVYCSIWPMRPTKDKRARARSIQGRMQMGMVRFPAFAPWWPAALAELLSFGSGGKHDDFVDWLSWTGLGLDQEVGAERPAKGENNAIRVGTMGWVKAASAAKARQTAAQKARAGF